MQRSAAAAALTLVTLTFLPGSPAAAEGGAPGSPAVGVALGAGASSFFTVGFSQDVSAELVVADCVAVGGMSLLTPDRPSRPVFVPFIAFRTPTLRSSVPYLAASLWVGRRVGTLALGYEGTLRGPLRLYGELGTLGAFDSSEGYAILPYGRVGVRLRF